MKTFSKVGIDQFDAVTPDTINENIDGVLSEFNGNLGANNMPVVSVTQDNLVAPELLYNISGPVNKFGVKYATQAYHSCERWGWDNGKGYGEKPDTELDLKNTAWRRGFNNISELTDYENFYSEFDAKQGMLTGQVTVDWEHGVNVFFISALAKRVAYGWKQWSEWGVFVNNVLVARSGPIYPRRHTTCIPFSVPVGSQNVRIDVRFITNTGGIIGPAPLDNNPTKMYVFGAEIVTRNVYR